MFGCCMWQRASMECSDHALAALRSLAVPWRPPRHSQRCSEPKQRAGACASVARLDVRFESRIRVVRAKTRRYTVHRPRGPSAWGRPDGCTCGFGFGLPHRHSPHSCRQYTGSLEFYMGRACRPTHSPRRWPVCHVCEPQPPRRGLAVYVTVSTSKTTDRYEFRFSADDY